MVLPSLWMLHDLALASRYCDNVVVLRNGAVAASGAPKKPCLMKHWRGCSRFPRCAWAMAAASLFLGSGFELRAGLAGGARSKMATPERI